MTDATAKATGTSLKSDADANIGAAVGVNYAEVDNLATVGSDVAMTASSGDITITANTAAGQTQRLRGVGLRRCRRDIERRQRRRLGRCQHRAPHQQATTGGSGTYAASGSLTLGATAPSTVQNLAISGALGDTAVGAAVAVTVVNLDTRAALGADETVTAGGSVVANALSTVGGVLIDLPTSSTSSARSSSAPSPSVAPSAPAATSPSAARSSSTWSPSRRQASIGSGTVVTAGGNVSADSHDSLDLIDGAGGLGIAPSGSAGIGAGVVVIVVNKDVRASIGADSNITAGGNVTASAIAAEDFLTFAASVGASNTAGVAASIIVVVLHGDDGDQTVAATIGDDSTVHAAGNMTLSATDDAEKIELYAGGLAFGTTAGVGASAAILVRTTNVEAGIGSDGDIEARARPGCRSRPPRPRTSPCWRSPAAGHRPQAWPAPPRSGSSNLEHLRIHRRPHRRNATTPAPSLARASLVSATDTTNLLGIAGALAIGGTAGVGVGADVEVLTKDTQAWIGTGATVKALGNVRVEGTSSEDILSISAGAAGGGTVGIAINASVSVLTVTTKAFIEGGPGVGTGAVVDTDGTSG